MPGLKISAEKIVSSPEECRHIAAEIFALIDKFSWWLWAEEEQDEEYFCFENLSQILLSH